MPKEPISNQTHRIWFHSSGSVGVQLRTSWSQWEERAFSIPHPQTNPQGKWEEFLHNHLNPAELRKAQLLSTVWLLTHPYNNFHTPCGLREHLHGKGERRKIRLPVDYCLSSNSVPHENPHKENAQVHTVSMIVLRKINKRWLWWKASQRSGSLPTRTIPRFSPTRGMNRRRHPGNKATWREAPCCTS